MTQDRQESDDVLAKIVASAAISVCEHLKKTKPSLGSEQAYDCFGSLFVVKTLCAISRCAAAVLGKSPEELQVVEANLEQFVEDLEKKFAR